LEGPLLNRLGAPMDHLGSLQELGLLPQGGQRPGSEGLIGTGVQLPGPCQVVTAGSQQLSVQAFQAGEETTTPTRNRPRMNSRPIGLVKLTTSTGANPAP